MHWDIYRTRGTARVAGTFVATEPKDIQDWGLYECGDGSFRIERASILCEHTMLRAFVWLLG